MRSAARPLADDTPPRDPPPHDTPRGDSPPGDGSDGTRAWAFWPLRVVALVESVLIFDQAVFAGRFLTGDVPALHTHREGATYTGLGLLAQAAAGLLAWRPGRGPAWPGPVSLGMFGLVAVQIVLGFARALAVHVPLGVALIAGQVLLLRWCWRNGPGGWPGPRRGRDR